MVYVLDCNVIGGTSVGVIDHYCGVITLREVKTVVGLGRSVGNQASPTLHGMSICRQFRNAEVRVLTNIM